MSDTEKKRKELKSVALEIFPAWEGKRTLRDFQLSNKTHKVTVGLPIPDDDDESQDLYGVSCNDLKMLGVQKLSYDRDTDFGKLLAKMVDDGYDFDDLDDEITLNMANQLEKELSTAKERKTSPMTLLKKRLEAENIDVSKIDIDKVIAAVK